MEVQVCGLTVLIDEEDFNRVEVGTFDVDVYGYVFGRIDGKKRPLHRAILGETRKSVSVHHINHNKLDCRKENLERVGSTAHSRHHQSVKKAAGRCRVSGKIKAMCAAEGISMKEALLRMKRYLSECRNAEDQYV